MKKEKHNLTPEAIADGAKSGLAKNEMLKLGMHSLDAKAMNAKFGIEAEGYVIPYSKEYSRARLFKYHSKFGEKLDRKYTQTSNSTNHLYFPTLGQINWDKVAKNAAEILLITEGEKKAAAACKAGYNCIGLGGVWNFKDKKGMLPEWDRFVFGGRTVLIVFDSDIVDKPQVRYAEYALSVELAARGANIMCVRLPQSDKAGDKVGLDDFLVANGLPESAATAHEAFDKLPREPINPALPPHLSELGNAMRMENEFGDRLRYVPIWNQWIVCNPKTGLWRIDVDGEAMRCAKQIPYILRREAKSTNNSDAQNKLFKWAALSESERSLNASIKLAKSESALLIKDNAIDSDPWKFAFKNGIAINLRSGLVRNILPEDYLMKSTDVTYDLSARCPLQANAQATEVITSFLPRAAERYREMVRNLGCALYTDVAQARECLKGLMGQIRLVPSANGYLEAELRYNTEGLLKLALGARLKAGMVAGAGFKTYFTKVSMDPKECNYILKSAA